MRTVLVTGGNGYIGGWCIVELLKSGYTLHSTLRSLTKEGAARQAIANQIDCGNRLTFFQADLTEDGGWDDAVKGCDYVLHVASPLGADVPKDPNEVIIPAREGTLRVLRAATRASVKRVVFLVTPGLGKKHTTTSAKAQKMLDWKLRPARATIIDCANSLLGS